MQDMRLLSCKHTRHVLYLTDGGTRKATAKREVYPLFPDSEILKNCKIARDVPRGLAQPLLLRHGMFTFFGMTLFVIHTRTVNHL